MKKSVFRFIFICLIGLIGKTIFAAESIESESFELYPCGTIFSKSYEINSDYSEKKYSTRIVCLADGRFSYFSKEEERDLDDDEYQIKTTRARGTWRLDPMNLKLDGEQTFESVTYKFTFDEEGFCNKSIGKFLQNFTEKDLEGYKKEPYKSK